MYRKKGNTMFFAVLAMVFLFALTGCKFIQVNPSLEKSNYETFGSDLGTFLKTTDPEFVVTAKPWIDGVLLMSDEQLLNANVLQTAYEYAMKTRPDDAALILLIKSGINLFGIKIDASGILPDERPAYVTNVRALIQAYSDATNK